MLASSRTRHLRELGTDGRWSLLDLAAPIRSQILRNLVGDLLLYSGANESNVQLDIVRGVCRELRDEIDEECLTFNYDDNCGLFVVGSDEAEIRLLNRWIKRHRRLKYFECVLHSVLKLRALLKDLTLPTGTRCSFAFEFKVSAHDIRTLLHRFKVRRLNIIPEDIHGRVGDWDTLRGNGVRTLCLRSCTDDVIREVLRGCNHLRSVQIVDAQLVGDPSIKAANLISLSLAGVVSMPDDQFSKIIAGCGHLRSLYLSKCHVSNISFSLPHLELLSLTHCRQLTDQCVSEILHPSCCPSLRFVDLTENTSLVSPTIAHPGIDMAWFMHCPQLTDQAVTMLFQGCPSITAANLVQSSIESALICSPCLRTLELATSQKLTDGAVSQLLRHCPSLTFLDVGHCCQLLEPQLVHACLETILLSFCVHLRESAIVTLFASCPSLRYVELAVCMFDMTRFQRECRPNCQVVVNFDF